MVTISLALVRIQPSGPTIVPKAASWALHLMRTTHWFAACTTWRKGIFTSGPLRPGNIGCTDSLLSI